MKLSILLLLPAFIPVLAFSQQEPAKQAAKQPFTFIQICDPQLGKGGYEHDLKTFEQAVVQSNALKPVFVVMHHPLYVKEPDEKDSGVNLPLEKRKELLALFEKHGVVAVLTGHAHRIIINDHKGIQMVTGEATSTNHGAKVGFRLWHIEGERPYKHESVPLEGF